MYKRPEFPEWMPKELQDQIIESMDKMDRHKEVWTEKLSSLSDEELAGVVVASHDEMERRKHKLVVEMAANDPDIRAKVLASLGNDDSNDLPSDLGDFDISDIIGGSRPN